MRKAPRRITETYLRNVAAWYLERYEASRKRLLNVLVRRVRRSAEHFGDDPEPGLALANQVADAMCAVGLVDDRRHAAETARRMRERGKSTLHIRLALRERGIASDLIDAALAPEEDEDEEPDAPSADRVAAARYVRRRGLGPFRRGEPDADRARKDLAAIVRAGFSFEDARAVLAMGRDAVETLALRG